jgi:transglutaminase-like putative cysteine protease
MKLFSIALLLSFFSISHSYAQDFEYARITGSDIELKNTQLDSNANAMVIREFGTTAVQLDNATGKTYIDFEYHVRIKIFNKEGFNHGNIVIPLRIYRDDEDEIKELKATTINFVNGQLVKTELDKKQVFNEKKNKYVSLTKFTMPNLMDGSIIEYSYRLHSPYIFNFKTWEFQSDIPKLHSEYIANIPAIYNYNVSLRGAQKLTKQNAEIKKECLMIAGNKIDCSKMTYIMKDVPALIEEDYMTAPSNFRSAIYYELSDYVMLNGGKKSITKTWKDVDYELNSDKSFGTQMKRKDVFKELMPQILGKASDDLSKAKAIYNYIRKNIKMNGFIGIYSENNIKTALEKHSGNTGDINLALIAALSAADLDAEAVILSTRANGVVNNLYPVISDFNYVVVKVNIGDKSYLLDATEPLLPFGLLPLHCINGNGRVINLKKPSYWYDLKASQKESTKYVLNAELTADGKLKGKLTTYSLGYAALKKRQRIVAANSVDEYVEKLDEQMPGISILKHSIENVDSLDNTLVEDYEIEMKVFDNLNADQSYFNPFFINRITKNPFNLNERTYPVDMGAASEERITMIIKLPANISVIDKPKDMSMALTENGGKYLASTSMQDDSFVFNEMLQFNKPIYESEDYLSLKEFYSRIIQSQKTDIVFKKTK